MAKESLKPGSS